MRKYCSSRVCPPARQRGNKSREQQGARGLAKHRSSVRIAKGHRGMSYCWQGARQPTWAIRTDSGRGHRCCPGGFARRGRVPVQQRAPWTGPGGPWAAIPDCQQLLQKGPPCAWPALSRASPPFQLGPVLAGQPLHAFLILLPPAAQILFPHSAPLKTGGSAPVSCPPGRLLPPQRLAKEALPQWLAGGAQHSFPSSWDVLRILPQKCSTHGLVRVPEGAKAQTAA